MSLSRSTEPLVWIDCEMTGLDPEHDTILSISCFITDAQLQLLDPSGFDVTIYHTAAQLSAMNDWCIRVHGESGLTQASLDSTTTASQAASDLLAYVKQHVPTSRTALLAGNSVHADKAFLAKEPFNVLLEHLHYRILDVSSIKEAVRRWAPDAVVRAAPVKKGLHQARDDILESIEEARFFRGLMQRL